MQSIQPLFNSLSWRKLTETTPQLQLVIAAVALSVLALAYILSRRSIPLNAVRKMELKNPSLRAASALPIDPRGSPPHEPHPRAQSALEQCRNWFTPAL